MCSTMEPGNLKLPFSFTVMATCELRCARAIVMLSSGPCEAYKAAYIIGIISDLAKNRRVSTQTWPETHPVGETIGELFVKEILSKSWEELVNDHHRQQR